MFNISPTIITTELVTNENSQAVKNCVEYTRTVQEYQFYKKLQYALGYNADCDAKVIACVPSVHQDFMFNITRSELLDLVTTRRNLLSEQLNRF